MKKIITAILLLVGFTGSAQWTKPNNSYGTISNGSNVKRALLGPTGCGSPTMLSADSAQKGYGQYFDSCNHVLYLYDPALASWDTVHVGAVAAGGNYLDSFWRVPGIDSNYYRINGVTYAVKDSTGGGSGTPSLTQYRLAIGDASNQLSDNAAITGDRALASDANGVPVASSTTATELGYVNGVTSSIQTQLNAKLSNITGLVTAGTNVTVTGAGTGPSPYVVSASGGTTNADSTAARIVRGTYAQRPTSPDTGQIYYQTDRLSGQWVYSGSKWNFYGDPNKYAGYNQYTGNSS